MNKESIAVFNPSDPLEKAIQNAFHEWDSGWLDRYSCKLLARAIVSLKMFDESWLNHPDLFERRIKYFFAPHMCAKKDYVVFPTTLLFLRDILENQSIDGFLIDPIAFVSRPISHYLLREYPIHIIIDKHKMISGNDKRSLDAGGLVVFDDGDVYLDKDCIVDIIAVQPKEGKDKVSVLDIEAIAAGMGYQKVALSLRGPGVFQNDEDKRNIKPGSSVWDKIDREKGSILKVEPGERGFIEVLLDSGVKKVVSQLDFDRDFVIL